MTAVRFEVTVGWGDCDPARIVFYPRYFHWFDAATVNLLARLGLALDALVDEQGLLRIPVVDSGATFHRPSRLGDHISIDSVVESWGESSFRIEHTVFNGGERALVGHEVRTWAVPDPSNAAGMRAVALPATVVALFDASARRAAVR